MLLTTVFFFDRNVEIAPTAGGVEIGQGKRPLRNSRLIDNVAILTNGDDGITFSNAPDDGCEAVQTIRQHVIIGVQAHAAHLAAIE